MESVFGDMIAKKEHKQLHEAFDAYEALISVVSVILFSVTAALIVPFVRIYTAGITDANYYHPVFAILITCAAFLYCVRTPYHSTVMAAGHFKQTRVAAYGETIINIGLSVLLVGKLGLAGVAIGTVVSTAFRYGYYIVYLSKHILQRSCKKAFMRIGVNMFAIVLSALAGYGIYTWINQDGYLWWAVSGAIATTLAVLITLGLNTVFYRKQMRFVLSKVLRKR
jgi:O-antigen/teichoic acid export membrane protein